MSEIGNATGALNYIKPTGYALRQERVVENPVDVEILDAKIAAAGTAGKIAVETEVESAA